MLSSVLRSRRAVYVNIEIMRAFVRMRGLISQHSELSQRLEALERKYNRHDRRLKEVFDAIRELMDPEVETDRRSVFERVADLAVFEESFSCSA